MTQQRILVIEDEPEARELLNVLLTSEGYIVDTAEDGPAAIKCALKHSPHLILSDYKLIGMNGVDTIIAIKETGLEVPSILITAQGSEEVAVQALRAGVYDYIAKPFDPDYLIEVIRSLLTEYSDAPPLEVLKERGEQASQLDQIFESVSNPIVVVDVNDRIIFCNKAAQTILINKQTHNVMGSRLTDVIMNRELLDVLDPSIQKTQCEIEINECVYAVRVSTLEELGRVLTLQDITYLKQMDRLKTDMVTNISHDLRSPLTAILSYAELISRTGHLNEQQAMFNDQTRQSVQVITELVNDLLNIDRLDTELANYSESVSIAGLVKQAFEALKGHAQIKNQTLQLEIEDNLPEVQGISLRLRQVFTNLIDNAVKYTPEGGVIYVNVYEDAGNVIAQVSDTGIGITPEEQSRIFEKGYRSNEVTETYDGRGIGLSIVKSIVESHNGRIWVSSVPGEGTTFTVMLPARES